MTEPDSDYVDKWTVQVRKGVLELCILKLLAERECYAYALVRRLTETPGLGLSEGTVYPLLSRLRVQGLVATRLVESAEGPARKYYALTPPGRRVLALMNPYFDALTRATSQLTLSPLFSDTRSPHELDRDCP